MDARARGTRASGGRPFRESASGVVRPPAQVARTGVTADHKPRDRRPCSPGTARLLLGSSCRWISALVAQIHIRDKRVGYGCIHLKRIGDGYTHL